MLTVLFEVIVEVVPTRPSGVNHEIAVYHRAIGEGDRRFVLSVKDFKDLRNDIAGQIGPPECSVTPWVLDQRPGVADQGRGEAKLLGNW